MYWTCSGSCRINGRVSMFRSSSREPAILAAIFSLGLAFSPRALAQAPLIEQGGIVNGASWSSPVAPGEIVSIFGADLAAAEQSASAPLPLNLGGTSVTINGIPAPLAFVSPTQINAYAPSSLMASGANIT